MRLAWVILLLATTAFAGCGGSAPDSDLDDVDLASGKGLIRGVVMTEAIVPLVNATVALMQTGDEAATDENGEFMFTDLEPGSYVLSASMAGYETVQSTTGVAQGVKDPETVKMLLPAVPLRVPDVVPLQWDGFIECSTSYAAVCSVLADVGVSEDEFNHLFDLEPGMDHIQTEMI